MLLDYSTSELMDKLSIFPYIPICLYADMESFNLYSYVSGIFTPCTQTSFHTSNVGDHCTRFVRTHCAQRTGACLEESPEICSHLVDIHYVLKYLSH